MGLGDMLLVAKMVERWGGVTLGCSWINVGGFGGGGGSLRSLSG